MNKKTSHSQMEEETSEVVLLGSWFSSSCTRVALALKLKGIPYKYVEEDLRNKSDFLLQHNPVHKKVPVLLHKGRPICESLIILEYIDETWNHSPKLLPEDPYQRAKVRFWANYFNQKVHIIAITLFFSTLISIFAMMFDKLTSRCIHTKYESYSNIKLVKKKLTNVNNFGRN